MRLLLLPALLLAALFGGCVSAKYQLAPTGTPQPVPLNVVVPAAVNDPAGSPLEATLHTVIVYRGPGSWKRDAYWDEYVITLANRGDKPATIEAATLIDFRDARATPGGEPWSLEKQSRNYETLVANTVGDVLRVGTATVFTAAAAGSLLVYGGLAVSSQASAAAVLGGTVTLAAAAVAIPVYTIARNIQGRNNIEAEFKRRQLGLPVWLVPGQIAQGSFFFRISPSPKRLVLRVRVEDDVRDVTIDLTRLAGLHLKNSPVVTTTNGTGSN